VDFRITSTTIEDIPVLLVAVVGELDLGSAEELRGPTEVAVSANCSLILDLSQCTFIDSSGLRAVLQTNHALAQVGATLVIATQQPQVKRVLSLTNVNLLIPVRGSVRDACAWFSDGSNVPNAAGPPRPTQAGGTPPPPAPNEWSPA